MSLKPVRLAVLFITFVVGTAAFGLCIQALVESRKSEGAVRGSVPQGTTVSINTSDILNAGWVLAAASGCLAVVTFVQLSFLLVPALPFARRPGAHRALTVLIAFFTVWLIGIMIPVTLFVATRGAVTRAYINGIQLPPALVQATQKALGIQSQYNKIGYLRILAIVPWVAAVFGMLATLLGALAPPLEPRIAPSAEFAHGQSGAAAYAAAHVVEKQRTSESNTEVSKYVDAEDREVGEKSIEVREEKV